MSNATTCHYNILSRTLKYHGDLDIIYINRNMAEILIGQYGFSSSSSVLRFQLVSADYPQATNIAIPRNVNYVQVFSIKIN